MTDPSQLSNIEAFWLGSLVLLMLGCVGWALRSRDPRTWLQPPLVMALILFYYAVAGPLNALHLGQWSDRGADLRYGMTLGWAGACVSFLSFLVGYALIKQRVRSPRFSFSTNSSQVHRMGLRLNIIGLFLFTLDVGGRVIAYLNPTAVAESTISFERVNLGAFSSYASLAINMMVPGCMLMATAWFKRRDNPTPLVVWVLVAMAIFTSLGFRWRIAILMGSLVMLWLLVRRVRPNPILACGSIFSVLFMAGFLGITRSYSKGLDLSLLEGHNLADILLAGFSESGVFLTSGALISLTPQVISYVGTTPLVNTILYPIPSALFPAKNSAAYFQDATAVIYNSDTNNVGSVLLNFAEYYLMAGWPAVIALSLLLGWICRRLWLWYNCRSYDPLVQVIYVCNAAYLYMVVSRGYMAQVVMLWCFTVLPLFVLYFHCQRRAKRHLIISTKRSINHFLPRHLQQLRS